MLVDVGDEHPPFLTVVTGQLQVVRAGTTGEEVVTVHRPGGFTGEVNMLSGRPGLVRIRALEASSLIEMTREELLALVQTDSELSEILMRAFILRRAELIAHGFGDVVFLGSNHCAATLRVKEFLTRNGHPYTYIDLDRDAQRAGSARSLPRDRSGHSGPDLPRQVGPPQSHQSRRSRSAWASTSASTRPTCAIW